MQFYNSGAVNAVSLYSCNVLRDNFLNNVCLHIGLSFTQICCGLQWIGAWYIKMSIVHCLIKKEIKLNKVI